MAKTSGIPPEDINYIPDSGAPVYLKDPAELPKALCAMKQVPGWDKIADPAALRALHVTPSRAPARAPSLVVCAQPDVWYSPQNAAGERTKWVTDPRYLWNHGTIAADILHTWFAMVGPGVKKNYVSNQWLDHEDTMPTVYARMGFDLGEGDFDGLPAVDGLTPQTMPKTAAGNVPEILAVENLYKQVNAPVGIFGMSMLNLSTQAALHASDPAGPALDKQIAALTAERDRIAADLRNAFSVLWIGNTPSATGHHAVDESNRVGGNHSAGAVNGTGPAHQPSAAQGTGAAGGPGSVQRAVDAAQQFLAGLR